jgi:Holliday junction resolvasome RuvABC endonuclease subunit
MKIKVIGIDPAFANIGLALGEVDVGSGRVNIRDLHLIRTEAEKVNKKVVRKNSDDLRRARENITALRGVIDAYDPSFVFAEVPTGAQSARASWTLGIAVGMLGAVTKPMIEVLPREVKIATGLKHPDKEDMIEWAMKQHPQAPWVMQKRGGVLQSVKGSNEHLADAVAVIHAGVATEEFKRMLAFSASL